MGVKGSGFLQQAFGLSGFASEKGPKSQKAQVLELCPTPWILPPLSNSRPLKVALRWTVSVWGQYPTYTHQALDLPYFAAPNSRKP